MAEENINNAEEIENEIEDADSAKEEAVSEENNSEEKTAEEASEAENSEEASEGNPEENQAGEDEDAGADEKNEDNGEAGKSSMFGRKNKELEKCRAQIDELTDKLKRNMAEFDNFRKRTDKEKANNYIVGARDVVEKILPVVDSFERGLAAAPEDDSFAEGMKLVYKQLVTALEDLGVEPIEAVGKEFDPNLHNAVMHVEDEEAGENVIVEEFQKGYTYKDTVVRHSMVKVAN